MLSVALYNARQHQQILVKQGSLLVGSAPEESHGQTESHESILTVDDPLIPAKQLSLREVESSTDAKVELSIFGTSIALSSGPRIHPGRTVQLDLPVSFCMGDTQIQIMDSNAKHGLDFGLTSKRSGDDSSSGGSSNQQNSPGPATLAAWLDTLGKMQRAVAGSDELFNLAARAVFNPGGLDGSMVLVPSQNGWNVAASHIPYPDHGIGFREDLVSRASNTRSCVYHDAKLTDGDTTTDDLHTAVVCPVLDANDAVIGVVYGFRSLHRRNSRRGIRFLEAQFVQVVADALSAAMIRLESEANAARSKVLLEQAFAPGIARQLQSNLKVLEATDREVTVLFADLRGFSAIAERIGTHDTYELLSDLMDRFTAVINDHDGVIIDYYGDGVSAFWNAPLDQPEHALLACQTGLEMLDVLPELNQIWAARIGSELGLGIGIHTGPARVGNSGSRTRLKYGPRGTTVNLASRLESLAKDVGVPMLISDETATQIEYAFDTTRVFRSPIRGISSPIDVYRVYRTSEKIGNDPHQRDYDRSLQLFESGNLDEALKQLTELKQQKPDDAMTEFLLGEVNNQVNVQKGSLDGGLQSRLITPTPRAASPETAPQPPRAASPEIAPQPPRAASPEIGRGRIEDPGEG